MFLRLASQWVYAGMGSIVGLNYQSMEFLFKTYRVKNRKKMFEEIQTIERAALATYRKNEEEG